MHDGMPPYDPIQGQGHDCLKATQEESTISARNARIASAVLATPIPFVRLSVCPSVRHTPVLCQNDGT